MLILGCKYGQEFNLDIPPCTEARVILVKVMSGGASRMRLGIQADKDVSVKRKELVVSRPPDGA